MNLVEDPWIPARRRSGASGSIAPWQLCDGFVEDPWVSVAAPRPDFDGALVQFLVGILQTCAAPEDARGWRRLLRQPPGPADLRARLAPFASHFNLDGSGPLFLQDLTLADELRSSGKERERTSPIGDLLIGSPTGKTLDDNTDLFVKRTGETAFCGSCAAAALLTLQVNAPSGGQGHRTGIRGGGPLTTLVLSATLWETCWLGVLERPAFEGSSGPGRTDLSDLFPWLAPTRTSDGGRVTTPEDAHPAQVFWAMPRRIRLLAADGEIGCDLCGGVSSVAFRQFQDKNLGVDYDGPWRHPLSPYYVAEDGTPSPIHPQPGGIGYRHWLGLVIGAPGSSAGSRREPALVVSRFLRDPTEDLRMWAFGYDMDNMKARAWCDSVMPLLTVPAEIRESFALHTTALVRGAELAAGETRSQLKKAMFRVAPDVKGALSFVSGRFWKETEPAFFEQLHSLRAALVANEDPVRMLREWHQVLTRAAERIFEDYAQSGAFDAADPKRIARAWRDLRRALFGKKLLESLGLPIESPSKPGRTRRRAR